LLLASIYSQLFMEIFHLWNMVWLSSASM
jgi:hypothetical protein